MKKNIGTLDRILRLSIGLLLLLYAWWMPSWIALIFALFCLFEAVASWCLFYQIIGKNSCPINTPKE
ncbi:MAG: DUF2892 domain-containing protein [Chlamydiales bacterium]|nr:DUF2892 domain-containing protein [Chlamydiales bacterium]